MKETATETGRNASSNEHAKIRITDTTLRDANQSMWAARMRGEDILRIMDVIDSVGYYSLEVWGGEPFRRCLTSLRENPWERLRMIKSKAKKTPLQMLLRGRHLVGDRDYPDEVIDRFIALASENGVDIFRIYDALNNIDRLETVIKTIKKYGGYVQGTVCYNENPLRSVDTYVEAAKRQKEMGVDSICINDITGLLSPFVAGSLVTQIRNAVDLPIQLHCHASVGTATAAYIEAVRAGAGALDCAISPMAGYSSLPAIETIMAAFRHTEYNLDLDFSAMRKVADFFSRISNERGVATYSHDNAEYAVLTYGLPYPMYSGIRDELAEKEELERLEDVCREAQNLRKELGYPPMYYPVRNMIASQALVNVFSSQRFETIHRTLKEYVNGHLGSPPGEIDSNVRNTISNAPSERLYPAAFSAAKGLKDAADELEPEYVEHEEDLVTYALFPREARDYFEWRSLPAEQRPEPPVDRELRKSKEEAGDTSPRIHSNVLAHGSAQLMLHPEDYEGLGVLLSNAKGISFSEINISKGDFCLSIYGTQAAAEASARGDHATSKSQEAAAAGHGGTDSQAESREVSADSSARKTIDSPIAGTFYSRPDPSKPQYVQTGETVDEGVKVCIVEAMKLFNEIEAPARCRLVKYLCADGDMVEQDQPLVEIELQ